MIDDPVLVNDWHAVARAVAENPPEAGDGR